jgi:hypothetical protein
MSAFRRTLSGLSNQHLFFDVDLIVFLEGGDSYNREEVYENKYTAETEDIIFWRNIFKKFKSNKRIKFKSIGSKSVVKEIASDVIDGQITTVMVAMDNEFDEVFKTRIEHPTVLYTHGYSWENDIWNEQVVISVIEELSAVQIENVDIQNNFSEFLEKIKIAVYSDAYLFRHNSSFFNREGARMFCVDCNPVDLPSIKSQEIEKKILDKGITRRKAILYGNKNNIDPLKFCFGHFLADYCCQLIQHYLKKRHTLANISKDYVYRIGINKHFDHFFEGGKTYEYYMSQLNKIEL